MSQLNSRLHIAFIAKYIYVSAIVNKHVRSMFDREPLNASNIQHQHLNNAVIARIYRGPLSSLGIAILAPIGRHSGAVILKRSWVWRAVP